jgi:hypothetical protein
LGVNPVAAVVLILISQQLACLEFGVWSLGMYWASPDKLWIWLWTQGHEALHGFRSFLGSYRSVYHWSDRSRSNAPLGLPLTA